MTPIMTELEKRRDALGMSQREFAAHLDVSDAQYSDTRRGVERFGQKLARGVARRFPDLARVAALAVISEEFTDRQGSLT